MNQPAPLPPPPDGMVNVFVDGALLHVPRGSTVMKACEQAGREIPHFCYHERLSIAGNCRMCLVEVEGMPKPVASCHWPVAEGMRIRTESAITHAARKGTMELLLANHPLDCPICDQGGECTLQDLAVGYGSDRSHFHEMKRAVDDKDIGHKIKTVMTRCIHCTRCIRFATEVAGVEEFGATGRGENMQVGTYVEQALQSELAGNMIDLCPVGALTSAPYAYTARPWELTETPSIDILEPCHASIVVDTRAGQVMRVRPRENPDINEEWIADTTRYAYDALSTNRLTSPTVKKGAITSHVGWPVAFDKIRESLLKGKSAMVMGPLLGAEDMAAAAMFMHDTLKSGTITALPEGLPADLPRTLPNLGALENASAVLLIGTNPRQEAPLLNLRLRKAARKGAQVFNIGPAANLTYAVAQLGTSPQVLANARAMAGATKALKGQGGTILIGHAALTRPDAAAILAAATALAKKTGAGLAILHPVTGILTALDLGIQTTAPAALLKNLAAGKYNTVFIYGDHPSLTSDILRKTSKNTTFVYLGTHHTALAQQCHICLPTAAWSEKSATYTNLEGKNQTTNPATLPPHLAKEDWKIFRALSAHAAPTLGKPLPFDTLAQLRERIRPATPAAARAGKAAIAAKPLEALISAFYLSNGTLLQSPWMHKLQAEVDQPTQQKVA